jgi:hypothetical protein
MANLARFRRRDREAVRRDDVLRGLSPRCRTALLFATEQDDDTIRVLPAQWMPMKSPDTAQGRAVRHLHAGLFRARDAVGGVKPSSRCHGIPVSACAWELRYE